MLNIKIICVGKLKEKYWQDACAEYMKRLGAHCNVEILEIKEERLPANASAADEMKVIEAEGREILGKIGVGGKQRKRSKIGNTSGHDNSSRDRTAGKVSGHDKSKDIGTVANAAARDYVIVLDVKGRELSSEELAEKISKISLEHSSIAFIIGGSLGLSDEVKERADLRQSFGKITLPHQLARVVTLEQIYRAFKINAGETYHK